MKGSVPGDRHLQLSVNLRTSHLISPPSFIQIRFLEYYKPFFLNLFQILNFQTQIK